MHWTYERPFDTSVQRSQTKDTIMHVVFGANGRAGGETARGLLQRGEPVRVVLRSADQAAPWKAAGAEVTFASIDDATAVAQALDGASSAFLLNPPPVSGNPYSRTDEIGLALAKGVRQAGLSKAVVLSSIGAQHASGTGVIGTLNRFEALLGGAAPAITFLRPGYFVETWGDVAEVAIKDGVLPTFLPPDLKIPMVSTMDVGRKAAQVLCERWTGEKIVELAGPADWSAGEVAAAFAEVLGRPVLPAFVPPEARAAMLADAGVPEEVATALLGMYVGLATGRVAHEFGGALQRGTVSLRTAVERFLTPRNPKA
jgi:uncharacterized protein YbjT (DUF2867 family)